LEARLGTDVAREQALQDALPEYYVDAVNEHDVDVIAPPEIQITAGKDDGDVEFDAVVEVRPQVKLVGYDELRVELPFQPVSDDDVDRQVDALRDRFADLTDSDFPLVDDAYATIDVAGTIDGAAVEGLTATDFLYRVGSAMVVDELDDQLRGTKPGAILEFTATLPERFGELTGREAKFRVMVKEAKQKVLPDVTDESRVGAARSVLADLALRAVVAQEAVTASDEELDAQVQQLAERTEQKIAKVRRELERSGALEAVRSDVARGKALEFLVDHAT